MCTPVGRRVSCAIKNAHDDMKKTSVNLGWDVTDHISVKKQPCNELDPLTARHNGSLSVPAGMMSRVFINFFCFW